MVCYPNRGKNGCCIQCSSSVRGAGQESFMLVLVKMGRAKVGEAFGSAAT